MGQWRQLLEAWGARALLSPTPGTPTAGLPADCGPGAHLLPTQATSEDGGAHGGPS